MDPKYTAALTINIILILGFLIAVVAYREELGTSFSPMLAVASALGLCVLPPTIATFATGKGDVYSFQDYSLQNFLPILIGFLTLFSIYIFDLIGGLDESNEFFVLCLTSASLLSSVLVYTFLLFRIKNNGT